jgi:hypothetical protein
MLAFEIARIGICTQGCGVQLRPGEAYRSFLVTNANRTDATIQLRVRLGQAPKLDFRQPCFQSDGVWDLYDGGDDGYLIVVSPPSLRHRPKCVVSLRRDISDGEILFCQEPSLDNGSPSLNPSQQAVLEPLAHPFDQLIFAGYLAQGRGTILHACGVVDEGRGFLFCGVSGAGKSTMANIWKPTHATLLSDDRIIVRRMDGVFRMYGTPWHGDANVCDPGNAPLEKVFFIVHADRNYAKPISPIDAASRLLVRCFPPFWDKEGMEFVTNFLAEVAEEVPCYELGFVPDQSVVEFVRSME